MLINLKHGEPIRFGENMENGVVLESHDIVKIAKVADVGESAVLVHDEKQVNPSLALALSRLASGPFMPTPIGVFRAVDRQEYAEELSRQIAYSQDLKKNPGDLEALLYSRATWEVT